MQRSKPEMEKEKGRQQQGGNDERQRDDLIRQQQQDDLGSRQPGKDPDILEDNEATDIETERQSRKPKVDDEPR